MINIAGSNNLTFPAGLQGASGPPGPTGTGQTGTTPTFEIGTVTTLAPGANATATITGTPEAPVLNLGIPAGLQGDPGENTQSQVTDSIYRGNYVGSSNTIIGKAIKYIALSSIQTGRLYLIEELTCGVLQQGTGNKRYRIKVSMTSFSEGAAEDNTCICMFTIDMPTTLTGIQKHVLNEFESSGIVGFICIDWTELIQGVSYTNINFKQGGISGMCVPNTSTPIGGGGGGVTPPPITVITDDDTTTVNGSTSYISVEMAEAGKLITLMPMAEWFGQTTLKNNSPDHSFDIDSADTYYIDGVSLLTIAPGEFITIIPNHYTGRFDAYGNYTIPEP